MNTISLAIHGGEGTLVKGMIAPEKELEYKTALKQALDVAYTLLEKGHSATEAVEVSVKVLENCHLFNADNGSFLQQKKHTKCMQVLWKVKL